MQIYSRDLPSPRKLMKDDNNEETHKKIIIEKKRYGIYSRFYTLEVVSVARFEENKPEFLNSVILTHCPEGEMFIQQIK